MTNREQTFNIDFYDIHRGSARVTLRTGCRDIRYKDAFLSFDAAFRRRERTPETLSVLDEKNGQRVRLDLVRESPNIIFPTQRDLTYQIII